MTIFVCVLSAAIVALSVTAFRLSAEKDACRQMIAGLQETVEIQQTEIKQQETYRADENNRLALYNFKENVFKLRYPGYLSTAEKVFKKSKEYGFNPYLIMALIQVESGFNSYAVSTAGAYGLMQVNYSVWKNELNIDLRRIYEKEYNIDLGLKILKHYYDRSRGNIFRALFHYNNGYKHNNTRYNGKIIATNFYANRNKINTNRSM
ncbi:MAG: lytic transglycosylase domain-containing protein [bacterium]|nr:lytic transglycosylase domain-containing protein [bacterium]